MTAIVAVLPLAYVTVIVCGPAVVFWAMVQVAGEEVFTQVILPNVGVVAVQVEATVKSFTTPLTVPCATKYPITGALLSSAGAGVQVALAEQPVRLVPVELELHAS